MLQLYAATPTECNPQLRRHRYTWLQKVQMATAPRLVSVHVLVAEIQKHLFDYRRRARCEETVEHDLLTLLAHFQARRLGLKEFCARLRVLLGAAVLKATVQGLSGQAAGASCSPRAWREDTSKERPAKRPLATEVASHPSPPAVVMGAGLLKKKRRASHSWTPAEEQARLRAFPALESGKQQSVWTIAGYPI